MHWSGRGELVGVVQERVVHGRDVLLCRASGCVGVVSIVRLLHEKGDVQLEHALAIPRALLRGERQLEKKREACFALEGDQLVQLGM